LVCIVMERCRGGVQVWQRRRIEQRLNTRVALSDIDLVLLDACRSAGLICDPSNTLPAADVLKSVLAAGNVTVLTSSKADQVSREDEKWQHSAFIQVLLDALSGPILIKTA